MNDTNKTKKRSSAMHSAGGLGGMIVLFAMTVISLTLCITSADALSDNAVTTIDVVESFSSGFNNLTSTALDGIYTIERVYKIPAGAVSAPAPDKSNFGRTTDPEEIEAVIGSASRLLGDDRMIWNKDITIYHNTPVEYYCDETILVVAWKEVIGLSVYNFAEVKIAHPSQFRKLFSENTYGSNTQYKGSQLGKSANAVLTSNADFYGFRKEGVVVYNGETYRTTGKALDNCFVDSSGDLLMVEAGTFSTDQEIIDYVEQNDVTFSLSFGPMLLRDGEPITSSYYPLGEPKLKRVRAAISQVDSLHYLLIIVDGLSEDGSYAGCDILQFANAIATKDVDNAYTIDGGQTAMLMMDDRIINRVVTGSERTVTDVIYFGTALPE